MDSGTRTMPGVGWLAAIGLVLVGALVLAFVLGDRGVTEYPSGSPEAAAQAYVQALLDGDGSAARQLMVPEDRFRCREGLIAPILGGDATTATFVSADVVDDRAIIVVRLSTAEFAPDPFAFDRDEDSRLVLERRDGTWLVSDADWPLDECVRR